MAHTSGLAWKLRSDAFRLLCWPKELETFERQFKMGYIALQYLNGIAIMVLSRYLFNIWKIGTLMLDDWCWSSFFLCFGVGGWSSSNVLASTEVYVPKTVGGWLPSYEDSSQGVP